MSDLFDSIRRFGAEGHAVREGIKHLAGKSANGSACFSDVADLVGLSNGRVERIARSLQIAGGLDGGEFDPNNLRIDAPKVAPKTPAPPAVKEPEEDALPPKAKTAKVAKPGKAS